LIELLLFRQKYGKRTSFSRNGSNLDITALAGYDLSGKVYTLNKATVQKITRTCPPPSVGKQEIYAVWRQARAEEAQRRTAPPKKISFDRRKFAPYLEKLGSDKELEELFLAFLRQRVG